MSLNEVQKRAKHLHFFIVIVMTAVYHIAITISTPTPVGFQTVTGAQKGVGSVDGTFRFPAELWTRTEEGKGKLRSKGRINNYVGHRLREIRIARKLTSQEVARRAGIAPGSYSCLENGWYKINLDNLFRILQVLKAEVTEVWPRSDMDTHALIDDDYLQNVVQDAIAGQPREVGLDDVYEAVCIAFEIPKDQFQSQSRWSRLTEARGAAALLIKDVPHLSLTALCRSLGCSISSMSHLTRRVQERCQEDEELRAKVDTARAVLEGRFPEEGKRARKAS